MDCFTSPTMNRLTPSRDTAWKMRSCTALESWYSSTMTSQNRSRISHAAVDSVPSAR